MSAQSPEVLFPPLASQGTLLCHASISQWGLSPHLCKRLWNLPGVAARAEIPSGSFLFKGEGAPCFSPWGGSPLGSSGREGEARVWLLHAARRDLLVGQEPGSLEGHQASPEASDLSHMSPPHCHHQQLVSGGPLRAAGRRAAPLPAAGTFVTCHVNISKESIQPAFR